MTIFERRWNRLLAPTDLHEGYVVFDVPRASDYPIDYYIDGGALPLYFSGSRTGTRRGSQQSFFSI